MGLALKSLGVIFLVLVVVALASTHVTGSEDVEAVKHRIEELFTRVEELGLEGVNVTGFVKELNEALKLVNSGDNASMDRAVEILNDLEVRVSRAEASLPSLRVWRAVTTYAQVAVAASIPILAYFLIPRAYVALWFRLRRRWLVASREV